VPELQDDIVSQLIHETTHTTNRFKKPQAADSLSNPEKPWQYYGNKRDWKTILRVRRSERFYDLSQGVEIDDLLNILTSNSAFYDSRWGDGLLSQYILFNQAFRKEIGFSDRLIYKFEPNSNRFACMGEIPDHIERSELFLQKEFSDAPVVIFFVGELETALTWGGTSAYKHMLLRAGAVAHNSWLCSMSYGYVGTVFAGVLPKALRRLCGIDGYRKCQLFAYSYGKPAEAPSERR